ncbi:guanine nucleotide-binding protein subunit alpha [Cladochytrium tenue]|nr:guanine nucleotide-binding protein subunit alpha [Cladochytrium tenue]
MRIASFQLSSESQFPLAIRDSIRSLWGDRSVRAAYERTSELPEFQDTVAHFFDELDRCTQPGYVPTNDDILRARHRTNDISETAFRIDDTTFIIYDVGGQRSLRQFWAPYLEGNLTAIIFVAALSSYDQVMFEDEKTNRMTDALALFGQVCSNRLLQDVSMILFLNKVDLFRRKIQTTPLALYLPEYAGPEGDYAAAGNFLREQFLLRNPDRLTYCHFTTGTDTAHMSVIITAVKDIVITNSLKMVGLL